MDDQDVLLQLLEVETKASDLVLTAQSEADETIDRNEINAAAEFSRVYDTQTALLEKRFNEETAIIRNNYAVLLQAYKEEVRAAPVNHARFRDLVHTLLFEVS